MINNTEECQRMHMKVAFFKSIYIETLSKEIKVPNCIYCSLKYHLTKASKDFR
jgi:hypothetical protein